VPRGGRPQPTTSADSIAERRVGRPPRARGLARQDPDRTIRVAGADEQRRLGHAVARPERVGAEPAIGEGLEKAAIVRADTGSDR
jgi:hypothetical protein